MFGIGGFELFLILLFGFLVFGPDKLPEIAKTIGKGIAKFRSAQEDMTEQLKGVSFMDKDSDAPFKNPLDVVETASKDAKLKAESAKQSAADAAEAAQGVAAVARERAESFAERKARYDRERAAKHEAEAKAEKEAEAARAAAEAEEAEKRANPKVDVAPKSLAEEED